MKKLLLLTVADSWHHFDAPIREYEKRLQKELQIIRLKPCKSGETATILRRDTENILKELQKYPDSYIVLCDDSGKTLGDSVQTSTWIAHKQSSHKSLLFIIGGSYGVDKELLRGTVDFTLSFSPWTLPHGLAVLTLLEQLYRTTNILHGGKYHHE